MREKVLITAALPYANGPLHFGHMAGAYLPADCFARFKRLQGDDVLFISGSDEYGVAITLSAELAKRTPKEHVDHFHKINLDLFNQLNISFDHYGRTTTKLHDPIVQEFFLTLKKRGFVEEKETEQLYAEKEDRFLADRYVVGSCPKCSYPEARGDECQKCGATFDALDLKNPRSKMTGAPLVLRKTKHWFLRLDLFKESLYKWLETKDWKPNVINFIKPYIEELKDRAITRDAKWGVPLPLEDSDGKVLYVWFDAPIGYISITQEWAKNRGESEKWKEYWLDPKTRYVQFIGKDNIIFHAVVFPAMVMGQDLPYKLVDALPANEFLNLEGKQFSKSSGWMIDMKEFLTTYSSDLLRYTLAANAPETQDSEFTWRDFQIRVNTELVGKFGNFIHRSLTFIHDRMEERVPPLHALSETDNTFLAKLEEMALDIKNHYEHFQLRRVALLLMELSHLANTYFDHKKPWVLLKEKENREALETCLHICLIAIRTMALVAFPILPESAEKIWKMLGNTTSLGVQNWSLVMKEELTVGKELPEPKPLFAKIEDEQIEKESAKLQKTLTPEVAVAPKKAEIVYDDFSKLDLRVGKIEHVEKVAKSEKLLKLSIDLGFEKRTIVSGIALHFKEIEKLLGKQVIVVANLKPVKLMGITSEGMVLAAHDGGLLELPTLADLPPGSTVS
ncbi:MAG: methionine--tRNA ligase [Verrucomicrobia bacterium]|nr:methionine--tRNA ligase [Verrucomicrobiota bacterium]